MVKFYLPRDPYNEMVKYGGDPGAAVDILYHFTRANLQHPTYKALVELGKALRT